MLLFNQIHCLDVFEGLQFIEDESVDLVVTDPPYNIGQDNKITKVGDTLMSNNEAFGDWDNRTPDEFLDFFCGYLRECYRILKPGGSIYFFSSREDNGYFIHYANKIGFKTLNVLAIIKENPLPSFSMAGYRNAFELCAFMCKGERPKTFNFISQQQCINTYHYLIGIKDTKHPTEKPLGFFKRIIKISSNEKDIVYDGFMGSGTTALACKQLNRNYLGTEKNAEYIKMAEQRLQQEVLFKEGL